MDLLAFKAILGALSEIFKLTLIILGGGGGNNLRYEA